MFKLGVSLFFNKVCNLILKKTLSHDFFCDYYEIFKKILFIECLPWHNLGQKFVDFFHFLAQFLFTLSEMELDYYHQKVNVRVAERLKTSFLEN